MAQAANRTMPYVRLGKSGLKVSRLILVCMSYCSPEWQGWVLREEEGNKHIKAAYDLGSQTFDTANVYSNGRHRPRRELAKKKGLSMAQLSLSWMLHKDVVSSPIVRSTSVDKLHSLIGALDIKLSEEEIKYLEEGCEPRPVSGH